MTSLGTNEFIWVDPQTHPELDLVRHILWMPSLEHSQLILHPNDPNSDLEEHSLHKHDSEVIHTLKDSVDSEPESTRSTDFLCLLSMLTFLCDEFLFCFFFDIVKL